MNFNQGSLSLTHVPNPLTPAMIRELIAFEAQKAVKDQVQSQLVTPHDEVIDMHQDVVVRSLPLVKKCVNSFFSKVDPYSLTRFH